MMIRIEIMLKWSIRQHLNFFKHFGVRNRKLDNAVMVRVRVT